MAAALGIPASSYLIYCFFNLLNPVISLLFSIVGIEVVKVSPAPVEAGGAAEPETRHDQG